MNEQTHIYNLIVPTSKQAMLKHSKPRAAPGNSLPVLGWRKSDEIQDILLRILAFSDQISDQLKSKCQAQGPL